MLIAPTCWGKTLMNMDSFWYSILNRGFRLLGKQSELAVRIILMSIRLAVIQRIFQLQMLQFTLCIQKISSVSNRLDKLNAVYNEYFKQPGISQFYTNLVSSYISLLSKCSKKFNSFVRWDFSSTHHEPENLRFQKFNLLKPKL